MLTLHAAGNRVRIKGVLPPALTKQLDRMMRYMRTDARRTTAFAEGRWDGYTHLFDVRWQTFPRGYLAEVEAILSIEEIDYTVSAGAYPSYRHLPLEWIGPELYDYQNAAVDMALEFKRGVIALPTGTGKTVTALHVIKEVELPTVILVSRKELMDQWERNIEECLALNGNVPEMPLGLRVGKIGEGINEPTDLTVAMVQTVTKRDPDELKRFGLLILDESHHTAADVLSWFTKRVSAPHLLGLSATPWREDGRDKELKGCIGSIIFQRTISDMIEDGYLARPTIEIRTVPRDRYTAGDYASIYTDYIVTNEDRNTLIVDSAHFAHKKKQVYVHVKRIEHGDHLASTIPGAEFIYGKTKRDVRRDTLDRFRKGKLRVLVSTLLGEGVDIPNMEVLILACGGKSALATIQTIGRVLRVTTEKKEVTIVDFKDQAQYLYEHYQARREVYDREPAFRMVEA